MLTLQRVNLKAGLLKVLQAHTISRFKRVCILYSTAIYRVLALHYYKLLERCEMFFFSLADKEWRKKYVAKLIGFKTKSLMIAIFLQFKLTIQYL